MSKRKAQGRDTSGSTNVKKYKAGSGFVDPNTAGIYATCVRGKELQCRQELMNLLSDKIGDWFDLEGDASDSENEDNASGSDSEQKLSVEQQIQQELKELKQNRGSKRDFLRPIELGCICFIFIKTKRPVKPDILVHRLCQELYESNTKTTRFTQKLTPISDSCSATPQELAKLAKKVLGPHFHRDKDQEPVKYAIQVSRRNFSAMTRDDIIKKVADLVGQNHGHIVDLKNYDKLIILECFKSNIGMCVVEDYRKLERFNLQQLYEKHSESTLNSRVVKDKPTKNQAGNNEGEQ